MKPMAAVNNSTSKRPRWSLRAGFWYFLATMGFVSIVVLLFLKKSIWVELEILLGVLSVFIFIFLFTVLYYGVVFERRENFEFSWKGGTLKDWINWASGADTHGLFTDAGSDAGPLGIVIGLILDLVVSMLLIFLVAVLLWLGFGALFTAIFAISVPLFFLVRRSLRSIVAKGRACRGKLSKSCLYALWSTATNAAWLYCILLAGHTAAKVLGK